jgi:hypothetical protein
LLLILLLSQIGNSIAYHITLHLIKMEMKQRLMAHIPEEALSLLVLKGNADDPVWEEGEREVYFQGRMYDIVKVKKRGHEVHLLALPDHKESALLQQYSRHCNENEAEASFHFRFASFPLLFAGSFCSASDTLGHTLISIHHGSRIKSALLKGQYQIQTPPPRTFTL